MGKHVNRDSQWFRDALIRAIRTFAQVLMGGITVGKMFSEIDWMSILSVALVATIYSLLTSVVTGLPESSTDGTLYIQDGDVTRMVFQVESEPDEWKGKSSVRLRVDASGKIPEGIVIDPNEE